MAENYISDRMSEHQRNVAARVAEGKDVMLEDYLVAKRDQIQCVIDTGIVVSGQRETTRQGQIVVDFFVSVTDTVEAGIDESHIDAIIAGCSEVHSDYVEALWAASPTSQEWVDALLETYRPQLLDCLASFGVDTTGLATMEDVQDALVRLVESEPNYSGPDCSVETGLAAELLS